MLREITIGQYYPADSILHKLDPRVKFLGTIVFIVSLFLVKGAAGYALVTVCLAALIILSKVPFKFMVKGMKAIFFVLIITMLFNLFLTPGEIIGRWWIFKVTREGIVQAVRMGIRLTYLVIGSSLMTLTTTPNKLTDAMESLFSPLKVFHAPVHEIAMMMSIALRFIPILMEETDKIMKAQREARILSREISSTGSEIWFRCWSRFSFPHSAGPMTLRLRWRRDAITAEKDVRR